MWQESHDRALKKSFSGILGPAWGLRGSAEAQFAATSQGQARAPTSVLRAPEEDKEVQRASTIGQKGQKCCKGRPTFTSEETGTRPTVEREVQLDAGEESSL